MEGAFDWAVIWKSRQILWDGFLVSLQLFGIALAGGMFFGTLLAMARLSRWSFLAYPATGFGVVDLPVRAPVAVLTQEHPLDAHLHLVGGPRRPVRPGKARRTNRHLGRYACRTGASGTHRARSALGWYSI